MTTSTATTRERIVAAAFTLFGRYGFKRTSMEDIASEAGLSRAALYLQFRNKEDIFRDLAGGLHQDGLEQAAAALNGEEPLSERLRAAVEAKKLRMIEITYASPHGNELIDEKNRLCGDIAIDSERRFQEMLTEAFTRADEVREIDLGRGANSAQEAAELFACAVHGLMGPEVAPDDCRTRLASFVKVFVAGLGG